MKITFISPYAAISNFAVRSLSTILRNTGHQTNVICLSSPIFEGINGNTKIINNKELIGQIEDIAGDSDMIGITLMSCHFPAMSELTRILKKLNKPIIWGGIHPTLLPEESLQYADIVCMGEGEDAILELAQRIETGEDPYSIQNLWFRGHNRNPIRVLTAECNFPMLDYGPDGHFAYDEKQKRLVAIKSLEHYQEFLVPPVWMPGRPKNVIYQIELSRGCPYRCTFCCNNMLRKIFPGRYLRFKPMSRIKEELLWAKKVFTELNGIIIECDTLNAYPDLKELCRFLREEIQLPFTCLLTPFNTTDELLAMLVQAGLWRVQFGLQSKSHEIEKLYGRERLNQNMDKIFTFLKKYNDRLWPRIDVIINCPWEKPYQTLQTVKFLNKHLPKRFTVDIFSLVLLPGSELWERAEKDGLLDPQGYLRTFEWSDLDEIQYTTILLSLLNKGFPRKLLWLLANKPMVSLFSQRFFTRGLFPRMIHAIKKPLH